VEESAEYPKWLSPSRGFHTAAAVGTRAIDGARASGFRLAVRIRHGLSPDTDHVKDDFQARDSPSDLAAAFAKGVAERACFIEV
jgi:hypothetical protein